MLFRKADIYIPTILYSYYIDFCKIFLFSFHSFFLAITVPYCARFVKRKVGIIVHFAFCDPTTQIPRRAQGHDKQYGESDLERAHFERLDDRAIKKQQREGGAICVSKRSP